MSKPIKASATKTAPKKASRKPHSPRRFQRSSRDAAACEQSLESPENFTVRHPHAAGIDLGARTHWAAVGPDKEKDVRSFGSFTPEIKKMAAWFKERGVREVAMEATGIYWIPVFEILEEEGFEVILVDAHACRNVTARKDDLNDAQWIERLHRFGLLKAAFRPAEAYCRLRTLVRQRKSLVESASMHTLHMHKALDEMNLHLHHVLSDVTGQSGLAIIEAILAGERNPAALARLADRRVKKPAAQIEAALCGNYREQTLFVLRQALESYHHVQRQVEQCDRYIEESLGELSAQIEPAAAEAFATCAAEPVAAEGKKRRRPASKNAQKTEHTNLMAARLKAIIGVDLMAVPGLGLLAIYTLLSEIGTDMSKWRNAKAFASWLGLCPNHKISGGRVLSRRSRRVVNRAATILRMAAMVLGRTETPLGCFFRRKRSKNGAPKAITATARKLACLIYEMIRTKTEYRAMAAATYEEKYEAHRLRAIRRQAEQLGYTLIESGELQAA